MFSLPSLFFRVRRALRASLKYGNENSLLDFYLLLKFRVGIFLATILNDDNFASSCYHASITFPLMSHDDVTLLLSQVHSSARERIFHREKNTSSLNFNERISFSLLIDFSSFTQIQNPTVSRVLRVLPKGFTTC